MNGSEPVLITFFPHATTVDNEAGVSTGQADTGLSPLGKEQVKKLEKVIADEKFDAIFSSDLIRARETAEGAFGKIHKIHVDTRLREIDIGSWTGKKDSFTEPIASRYIDKHFPGGESYKDVEKRVNDFLNGILMNYAGKKIAIVGHQATQLALDVLLKGLSWPEAIEKDWRKNKAFQYGWDYILKR